MQKNCFFLLFIFIFSIRLFSQTGTIKIANRSKTKADSTKGRFFIMPEIGYAWQGYNNIEFGIRPSYFLSKSKGHTNISITLGGNIFKHHLTYVSPFVNVKYYKEIRSSLAINFCCNYSLTKVSGVTDQRITPEIGLAFFVGSISYGYNISVGSEKIPFISPHKITVRWTAF